jgi:hypothetical protein
MKLTTSLSREDQNHLKNVMNTVSGRAYIWRLLDEVSGFHQSPLTNNAGIYCNVAKQDVGRDTYDNIMVVCPDLYTVMRKEAEHKQLTEEKNANG